MPRSVTAQEFAEETGLSIYMARKVLRDISIRQYNAKKKNLVRGVYGQRYINQTVLLYEIPDELPKREMEPISRCVFNQLKRGKNDGE